MSDLESTPTYYQMNKDRIKEYKKQWRIKNKEKVKEYDRQYQERNKDTIKKRKQEYYRSGYYNNKLVQRFNVLRGEILIGNNSEELMDELKEIVDIMYNRDLLDEDQYNDIIDTL